MIENTANKSAFTPEEVRAIRSAYQRACAALGLSTIPDRLTGIVAQKIIEMAYAEELDPERLARAAVAQLRTPMTDEPPYHTQHGHAESMIPPNAESRRQADAIAVGGGLGTPAN
jgi:nucleotide-binding universal stress UspA family protein